MSYKNNIFNVLLFYMVSLLVSACVPELTLQPAPPTPTLISPFGTKTISPQKTITPTSTPDYYQPKILHVTPTPTPVIHSVQSGETLSSIAVQYNTTIDAILSANPGVDPNLLPIGITLTVPFSNTHQSFIPLPTPVELDIGEPVCFRSNDMNLTCFLPTNNNSSATIENVSILVTLYDKNNDSYQQKRALLPQNTLPPQTTIPAIVRFYNISEVSYITDYHVETAIYATDIQNRYVDVDNTINASQISSTGMSAKIEGNVILKDRPLEKVQVTIVAIAKDKNNIPIGFRKITSFPSDTQSVSYSLYIYTLGPPIAKVDVYAEALKLIEN